MKKRLILMLMALGSSSICAEPPVNHQDTALPVYEVGPYFGIGVGGSILGGKIKGTNPIVPKNLSGNGILGNLFIGYLMPLSDPTAGSCWIWGPELYVEIGTLKSKAIPVPLRTFTSTISLERTSAIGGHIRLGKTFSHTNYLYALLGGEFSTFKLTGSVDQVMNFGGISYGLGFEKQAKKFRIGIEVKAINFSSQTTQLSTLPAVAKLAPNVYNLILKVSIPFSFE